jgi:hypothetical protein
MSKSKLREYLAEIDEGIVLADGHDSAFVGIASTPNGVVAVYSCDAIISNLMNQDMMDEETAIEYAEFNIFNCHVGDRTPIFLETVPWDEEDDSSS